MRKEKTRTDQYNSKNGKRKWETKKVRGKRGTRMRRGSLEGYFNI